VFSIDVILNHKDPVPRTSGNRYKRSHNAIAKSCAVPDGLMHDHGSIVTEGQSWAKDWVGSPVLSCVCAHGSPNRIERKRISYMLKER
jgi:hypothetical protein